ncbi:hypothetical protein T439DRAFT_330626 [Meredithblackwellia eburnea MCA 4105]
MTRVVDISQLSGRCCSRDRAPDAPHHSFPPSPLDFLPIFSHSFMDYLSSNEVSDSSDAESERHHQLVSSCHPRNEEERLCQSYQLSLLINLRLSQDQPPPLEFAIPNLKPASDEIFTGFGLALIKLAIKEVSGHDAGLLSETFCAESKDTLFKSLSETPRLVDPLVVEEQIRQLSSENVPQAILRVHNEHLHPRFVASGAVEREQVKALLHWIKSSFDLINLHQNLSLQNGHIARDWRRDLHQSHMFLREFLDQNRFDQTLQIDSAEGGRLYGCTLQQCVDVIWGQVWGIVKWSLDFYPNVRPRTITKWLSTIVNLAHRYRKACETPQDPNQQQIIGEIRGKQLHLQEHGLPVNHTSANVIDMIDVLPYPLASLPPGGDVTGRKATPDSVNQVPVHTPEYQKMIFYSYRLSVLINRSQDSMALDDLPGFRGKDEVNCKFARALMAMAHKLFFLREEEEIPFDSLLDGCGSDQILKEDLSTTPLVVDLSSIQSFHNALEVRTQDIPSHYNDGPLNRHFRVTQDFQVEQVKAVLHWVKTCFQLIDFHRQLDISIIGGQIQIDTFDTWSRTFYRYQRLLQELEASHSHAGSSSRSTSALQATEREMSMFYGFNLQKSLKWIWHEISVVVDWFLDLCISREATEQSIDDMLVLIVTRARSFDDAPHSRNRTPDAWQQYLHALQEQSIQSHFNNSGISRSVGVNLSLRQKARLRRALQFARAGRSGSARKGNQESVGQVAIVGQGKK